MSEEDERRLSLIPYSTESQQVVLRHGNSIVKYDQVLKQLTATEEIQLCPTCRRPYDDAASDLDDDASVLNEPQKPDNWVSPHYFRMLQHSRPPSSQSSRNPSPRYKLLDAENTEGGTPNRRRSPTRLTPNGYKGAPQYQGISAASFSQGYYTKFFIEEAELGRGGKGVVFLVRHVLDGVSLGRFACKRVPVGNDRNWLGKALHEVSFLQDVSHENLVSYRHVWLEWAKQTPLGPSVPCAFILQQYCDSGDLHGFVLGASNSMPTAEQLKERARRRSKSHNERDIGLESPKTLHFDQILSFFRDVCLGMRELHSHGYIHRDLKPSNCLLHAGGGRLRVLVSDFGEMQGANTVRQGSGATGSLAYSAPEVLLTDGSGTFGDFTKKSDVFSLGMVLHFMCFGRLPYSSADDINAETEDLEQLRAEICAWAGIAEDQRDRTDLPEQLYQTLKLLLSTDPNRRPTIDDIVQGINSVSHPPDRPIPKKDPRSPFPHIPPDESASPMESPNQEYFDTTSTFSRPHYDSDRNPKSKSSRPVSPEDQVQFRNRRRSTTTPTHPDQDAIIVARKTWSPILQGNRDVPRLLPPPPRRSLPQRVLIHASQHWLTGPIFRTLLFVGKLWYTLSLCDPFATTPLALYLILAVAALDLAGLGVSLVGTAVFMSIHVALSMALARTGRLCAQSRFV